MLFRTYRVLLSFGFIMGLIAIHFATPLPPAKRSATIHDATKSGFSRVPKVLEIQLPLKIVSKDDLVSWAKYVMSLMASKINITFSSIRDANTSAPEVLRNSYSEPIAPHTVPRSPLENGGKSEAPNFSGSRPAGGDINDPRRSFVNHPEPRIESLQGLPHFFVGFSPQYHADKTKNQEVVTVERSQSPFDGNQGFSGTQAQYSPFYQTDGSKYQEQGILSGQQQTPLNALFLPVGNRNGEVQSQLNPIYPINGANNQALSKQQSYLNSLHRPEGIKSQELFAAAKQQTHPTAGNRESEITRLTKTQDSAAGSNPYDRKELEIFKDAHILAIPVQTKFLPLPLKVTDGPSYRDEEVRTRYYYDGGQRNGSSRLETDSRRTSATHLFKNEPDRVRNSTTPPKSTLTLPFQAFITITHDKAEEQTANKNERRDHFGLPLRDPPDEFPPYFPKNFTAINESGKISVILDEPPPHTEAKKETQKKSGTMKRQSSVLSQLLLALGLKRRNGTRNGTDITVTPPVIKILKGPTSQNVQLDNETTQARGRRNETANQEFEEQQELDEQSENQEESDDDEKANQEDPGDGQGSLQAVLDLLPLIVPILEDISAPNSEVDLTELVNAAVPLFEGLSEGDEETPGVDIAAALAPILTRLLNGPNGQGVDSAAVLPPIISIVGPLIGALIGPLTGPLIRALSTPGQGSDFSAIVQSIAAPLSTPTGYGKQSPFSNVVAGIVSSLSKELVSGGSDISALVSAVVSGVLTGASAGLKGGKKGYPDAVYSPTSYGGYGANSGNNRGNGYGTYGAPVPAYTVSPIQLIGTSIKELLGAGSKAVSAVFTAITGILGASSKDPGYPAYGPPNQYKPPSSYGPPSTTRSPYAAAALRPPPPPRQTRPQREKI